MALPDDAALRGAAQTLAESLRRQGFWLVTAESCTGGWVAKVCTDLAGSSAWFSHGLVSYSNAAKSSLLGVQLATLRDYGAVSAETAGEMAAGARGGESARVSLAVTGIAGPAGGTAARPVGLVWFGWGLPDGSIKTCSRVFTGDRDAVRRQSVLLALDGLRSHLESA